MPCVVHPDVEAPWECVRCGATLCEGCVRYLTSGMSVQRVPGCSRCGSVLRPARRTLAPPMVELRELVKRPFSAEGLLTAGALAVPATLAWVQSGHIALVFRAIYMATLSGYYFQTVDHVGRGAAGLPFSADSVFDKASMLKALSRGLVCFGIGFGPMLFWRTAVPDVSPLADLVSSLVWLLAGLVWMPAVVISTVLGNGALAGAWPINWVRVIRSAPVSYARFTGLFVGTVVAGLGLFAALHETIGRIPVLGDFLAGMALTLAAILQAVIIGGFLRRNAEEFGYD